MGSVGADSQHAARKGWPRQQRPWGSKETALMPGVSAGLQGGFLVVELVWHQKYSRHLLYSTGNPA